MLKDIAEAMLGRRPFDLVIRNVQIVNVFSASIADLSALSTVISPGFLARKKRWTAAGALMAATLMPCLASWILTCIWRAAC